MKSSRPFLALLAGLMLAPAAQATDLLASYEAALKIDPDLLAAEQALLAGREKSVQGNALLMPKLQLEASVMRVDNESNTGLPETFADLIKTDSRGTVHEAELQLQQPLYDAESFAQRRQLREQTRLATVTFRSAQQDLIERIGKVYLDTVAARDTLRVVLSEKAAAQMQRDRAQARFEVGKSNITDVQEAQARYDAVVAREVSSRGTLQIREAQYAELTGLDPAGLAPVAAGLVPTAPVPDDVSTWQARGLDQNPRVQTKMHELTIAQHEIDKYRLAARPKLDLVASYDWQGQDGGLSPAIASDRSETAVVGLQLSVPLFTGGALNSRQREAEAKERQTQQELLGTRRDVRLEVQNAFLDLHNAIARVHSLEQATRSAQTALEATTLGRDVGTRTELDVLDAQRQLYSAELDWIEARHEYLLDRIQLWSAAGDLQPDHLRELNALLEST